MEERERERIVEEPRRVERETTVIATGEGRGGGGTIVALVVLLALIILAFLYFSGTFGGEETNLNVNIDAPEVDVPDVDLPAVPGNSS